MVSPSSDSEYTPHTPADMPVGVIIFQYPGVTANATTSEKVHGTYSFDHKGIITNICASLFRDTEYRPKRVGHAVTLYLGAMPSFASAERTFSPANSIL